MTPTRCSCLALAAQVGFSGVALAQVKQEAPPVEPDAVIPEALSHEVTPGGPGRFEARTSTLVYSVGVPSETGGTWNNPGNNIYGIADDISFSPGPGEGQRFYINGISFGWVVQPTIVQPYPPLQIRFAFYDAYTPGTAPPFAGLVHTAVWDFIGVNPITPPWGLINYYREPLPLSEPLPWDGSDLCIMVSAHNRVTGMPLNDVGPAYRGTVPANQVGNSPVPTLHTHNSLTSGWGTFGGQGNNRRLYIKLWANLCLADFNQSGATGDDADIATFFVAWTASRTSADINASGGAPDDADVALFFQRWAGGC